MTVQGVLRPSPPGKEQSHELHAEKVDVIGAADPEVSFDCVGTCNHPHILLMAQLTCC